MGKRLSPGERRLRGLLSGDPDRVARSLRRSVWTNNPEIYATIAASKERVIAAIADMALPGDDAEDRRDRLFARFSGKKAAAGESRECPCATGGARGDPAGRAGFEISDRMVYAGHSELKVNCRCGRSYRVVEDVGYHTPQWTWR